ncbi:MAG: DUF2142 domain-containing protein [Solirubrobacterales bacterium]|nr:DUF2142 domain-containing protein [Solirubrobacterales bacterium]
MLAPAKWQKLAMAAVLAIAALLALLAFTPSKPRLSGNNGVSPDAFVVTIARDGTPLCTKGVTLPAGTDAVRLWVGTYRRIGVKMTMTARNAAGKQLGTSTPPAFNDGAYPTFKVPSGLSAGATLCFRTDGSNAAVAGNPNGNSSPEQISTIGKKPVKGDLSIEYMRAGSNSTWSMIPTIFSRAALFRPSWVGAWTYWLAALLAFGLIAAAWVLLLRAGRLKVPASRRMMIAIAAIAFANAAIWALVTPAFNTPDELAHFTYVETVANGELPQRSLGENDPGNSYLPSTVYAGLQTAQNIIGHPFVKPSWERSSERTFEMNYDAARDGPDEPYGLTPANTYTPLYYAPAVVPYAIGSLGNIWDKLFFVRLYSALFLAFGVIFAMLFVRELLPRQPWAPIVAGLAIAFEPMVVHLSGGASNDSMMLAACAATLWAGAIVLRRGPTFWSVFGATGALLIAATAKPTSFGLIPALAFAVLVAVMRSEKRLVALRTSVLGAAIPLALLVVMWAVFGNDAGTATVGTGTNQRALSATGFLSYLWQWYLPSIGSMDEYFVGAPPAFAIFFGGFIADFNALDTRFDNDFYKVAAFFAFALFVLVLRAVWLRRDRLKDAWPIVAYPAIAILGTMFVVNVSGYLMFIKDGQLFAQGRYLFPALAVFGLYIAAAAIGAGRRYGLPLASAVVMTLAMTNLAGMAITFGRFYL